MENYTCLSIITRFEVLNPIVWVCIMKSLLERGKRNVQRKEFGLGDIVQMKKGHPCGTNAWKVIRMGMDIRMKCTGCDHSVLLSRARFEQRLKKVLVSANQEHDEQNL